MDRRRKFTLRRSTRSYYNRTTGGGGGGSGGSGDASTSAKGVHLRWNMQSQHVLNELGRLYRKGGDGGDSELLEGMADVTLFSSEGDCVQAHKIVLMLCSPYFKKLFNQVSKAQMKSPRENSVVVLSSVKTAQLQHFVRFLYTGEVKLSPGRELEEFQKVTRLFGVAGLSPTRTQTTKIIEDSVVPPADPLNIPEEKAAPKRKSDPKAKAEEEEIKVEPPEDIAQVDESEDDLDFAGHNNMDDDAGSNFSDCLQSREREALLNSSEEEDDDNVEISETFSCTPNKMEGEEKRPVGRPRLKPRSEEEEEAKALRPVGRPPTNPPPLPPRPEDEELRIDPRTGKLTNWIRIDPLSDEELKRDWRKKTTVEVFSNISTSFYCPYGGRMKRVCPAMLKMKTLRDGTTIFFRNPYDHDNHRGPNDETFGMTAAQKQFVLQCLDNGITLPGNILLKFEVSDVQKPPKAKLVNLIQRLRKKYPEKFGSKPEPKWPRRIRKKKPYDGPPKKRGRPPQSSKQEESGSGNMSHFLQSSSASVPPSQNAPLHATTSSASSSPGPAPPPTAPVPGTSSSAVAFQTHPNHFPAFPFNPLAPPPHFAFNDSNYR